MFLQIINTVKVMYQGQGHIKVIGEKNIVDLFLHVDSLYVDY